MRASPFQTMEDHVRALGAPAALDAQAQAFEHQAHRHNRWAVGLSTACIGLFLTARLVDVFWPALSQPISLVFLVGLALSTVVAVGFKLSALEAYRQARRLLPLPLSKLRVAVQWAEGSVQARSLVACVEQQGRELRGADFDLLQTHVPASQRDPERLGNTVGAEGSLLAQQERARLLARLRAAAAH